MYGVDACAWHGGQVAQWRDRQTDTFYSCLSFFCSSFSSEVFLCSFITLCSSCAKEDRSVKKQTWMVVETDIHLEKRLASWKERKLFVLSVVYERRKEEARVSRKLRRGKEIEEKISRKTWQKEERREELKSSHAWGRQIETQTTGTGSRPTTDVYIAS